jgi:anti-sigma factor RsiW
MSDKDNPIPSDVTEAELLALADNRLPADRRAAVAAFLAANAERAADVALWQRQNEAIATLFDHTARQSVPERLDPHRLWSRRPRRAALAAAAVVLLALGAGAGWLGRAALSEPSEDAVLIAAAVNAHTMYTAENRHAVEVAAAEQDHLVTWLSRRIDRPISAPDLTTDGFNLVGGRLLPAGASAVPAAQLMYENAEGHRVTVFVTASPPATARAYEFTTVAKLGAVYWSNPDITCTVVGDLPEEQLRLVARQIYRRLVEEPATAT